MLVVTDWLWLLQMRSARYSLSYSSMSRLQDIDNEGFIVTNCALLDRNDYDPGNPRVVVRLCLPTKDAHFEAYVYFVAAFPSGFDMTEPLLLAHKP
ncbi:uncharacterized protein G2W53_029834 [Senna tora]|uniref:Uncharacterized protein n=1 Tax=Senna tora TaxID=362788 RepID=A0A834T6D0_9FABA|nr:uncharacterized protein G2W53_029834 [Senna tora]